MRADRHVLDERAARARTPQTCAACESDRCESSPPSSGCHARSSAGRAPAACGRPARSRRPPRSPPADCGTSAGRPATSTRPCAAAETEDRLQQLGAAGTDQAGDSHDLARRNVERDVLERARQAEIAHAQHASPTSLAPSCVASKFSSSRPTISAIRRGRSKSATMPPPTVCPSRRTVTRSASANSSPSRCETKIDRHALGAQAADEPEERLDLVLGERARRLVEDQHASIDRERPGDLDHLLLIGPEPAHRHGRVEIEIQAARAPPGRGGASRASRSAGCAAPCGARGRCSRRSRGRARASSPA